MANSAVESLERFHQFVGRQLTSQSSGSITPDEALRLWHEREESLAAIREGIADVEAGRTRPAEEVMRELRLELDDLALPD